MLPYAIKLFNDRKEMIPKRGKKLLVFSRGMNKGTWPWVRMQCVTMQMGSSYPSPETENTVPQNTNPSDRRLAPAGHYGHCY